MMQGLTRIQIFISCPGDLAAEKRRLESICENLNQVMEENDCLGIFRINDYKNIVAPIGTRPQAVINERYASYDFYFGLLYKRFGTPTGADDPDTGQEYPSGTYEEFKIASRRQANENGRPEIYFFFKDPGELPADDSAIEQLNKIKQFKQEIGGIKNYIVGFNETSDFGDKAYKILFGFLLKFCSGKLDHLKVESVTEYNEAIAVMQDIWSLSNDINTDLALNYVSRTVTSLKDLRPKTGNWIERLWEEKKTETLAQALLKYKHIVLLGNAGSGKSTELANLVKECRNANIPFIPVCKRFNTYVDQLIEDFLPKGWQQVSTGVCLVIIDGLDEVQPQHFNTAIRNIQNFANSNPKLRVLVSCRNNFYPLPEKGNTGLLSGFQIYFLDDLSANNAMQFAQQQEVNKPENFVVAIEKQGFNDLIGKPFFLEVLINAYKIDSELKINRKDLFGLILESRITKDVKHFETAVPLGKRKQTLIRIIERIALVMEAMGTNVIAFGQLQEILNEQHLELLEYFPAFGKVKNNDQLWSFEHNNIQEYLAARVLSSQPLDKIKELIVTGKTKPRLKQSWLNTLSFLVSLGDETLVSSLIKWLAESEPDVMVKFESARVPIEVRKGLFYHIYGIAKERKVWIRSSIFSEEELAKFSQCEETFQFLIKELADDTNVAIVRNNALRLLRYFDLNYEGRKTLEKALLALIDAHPTEYNTLHILLYVVRDKLSGDKAMLQSLIDKLGTSTNQYVRAGMYAVLADSPYINDYVDYLIDGVMVSQKGTDEQREGTTLADESWNLQRAFKQITRPDALKKVLEFFALPYDRRHVNYYERPEVLTSVTNNAVDAYYKDPTIFDAMLQLFVFHGRHSTKGSIQYLRPFFDQTGTRIRAFEELRKMRVQEDQRQYERRISLLNITNRETVDHAMILFKEGTITDAQLQELFNDLDYYLLETEEDRQMVAYFRECIEKETNVDISRPVFPDHRAIQTQRNQQSFDLLFDHEKFGEELERLYTEIGKEGLEFNDLWDFSRNNQSADAEDYFARCVLDLLREKTRSHNGVTLEEVETWMKNGNFTFFSIDEAYNHLKNYSDIQVSDAQKQFIEDWCNRAMDKVAADKYAYLTGEDQSFSVNTYATLTWFFLKKLDIQLQKSTLLNFTLFIDVDKRDGDESELNLLKKYVGKRDVDKRVIENLQQPLYVSHAWRNNAMYALNENLVQGYEGITLGIQSMDKDESDRVSVLRAYYAKTRENELLKNILEHLNLDEVFWASRDLWQQNRQDVAILINVMRRIMNAPSMGLFYQIKAAEQLIQLGDDEAFYYFTGQVLNGNIRMDDMPHKLDVITRVTKITYLPRLMELLLQAKQPENMEAFRAYDHMIIAALKTIAIQSEDNMIQVTNDMRRFIDIHPEINHIQFMHQQIDDIETSFSLQESQQYDLKDVLAKINQIRPES